MLKKVGLFFLVFGLLTAALLAAGVDLSEVQGRKLLQPFAYTDAYVSDGGKRPLAWAFRALMISGGALLLAWERIEGSPRLRGLAAGVTGVALAATTVAGVFSANGVWTFVVTVPLGVALVWVAVGARDPRTVEELAAFETFPARRALPPLEGDASDPDSFPAYRYDHRAIAADKAPTRLRKVDALPASMMPIVGAAGGGTVREVYVLREGLAYVAIVEADAEHLSDHVSVVMRLDERGPLFTARPLPWVDGKPAPNTGVVFSKDPEFTGAFLVESGPNAAAKAIRSFLSPSVRDALLELPVAWLRVDVGVMALTHYGRLDADYLDALVDTADVLFAEHGAEGGPTLLEPDVAPAPPKKKKKAKKKPAASQGAEPSA